MQSTLSDSPPDHQRDYTDETDRQPMPPSLHYRRGDPWAERDAAVLRQTCAYNGIDHQNENYSFTPTILVSPLNGRPCSWSGSTGKCSLRHNGSQHACFSSSALAMPCASSGSAK